MGCILRMLFRSDVGDVNLKNPERYASPGMVLVLPVVIHELAPRHDVGEGAKDPVAGRRGAPAGGTDGKGWGGGRAVGAETPINIFANIVGGQFFPKNARWAHVIKYIQNTTMP